MADKDELVKSGKFFARKFTGESDADILNFLDNVMENDS